MLNSNEPQIAEMSMTAKWDVFVCHASEDKLRFVEPLLRELASRGVKAWYDRSEIKLGDNIAAQINDGLARSRFGVVVLSPRFWKYWTGEELGALHALESLDPEHRRRIIPVCFEVDHVDIADRAPLLVGRLGIPAGLGVDEVARRIADSVGPAAGALAPLAPGLGRARIYNLPERPRAQVFVGRDQDMATLEGLLTPGADVGVAAAVEGLFGVGKTEVALQLAHRLAMTDRFPGGIFWLDGSQADLTAQWGGRIADEKRIGQGPQADRTQAVLGEISSNGAALVILDNVEAWSSSDAPKPLPHGAHITRLVTTRARDLGGSSFKRLTLGVLSDKDSRELLLSLADAARDGEVGLDALLTHLDGLALAVELAGAYLRKFPTVTVVEYLGQLLAGAPVEDKVVDKVRYEATVQAAFNATYAKLDEASQRALRVCGCFADADASIALLRACGVELDAETTLRDTHLIVGGATRWSMHRLVRSKARQKANSEEGARSQESFVAGCLKRTDAIELDTGFRIYRSDLEHFAHAIELLGSGGAGVARRLSTLLDRVGTGAQSSGDLVRAKELLERALAIDLRNLGADHPDAINGRLNLANLLADLGELLGAAEMLEAALASGMRTLGETDVTVSMVRATLGSILADLGDLPQAKEMLERALADTLHELGDDHLIVSKTRARLAIVLDALGDIDGAIELHERALAVATPILGEDSPDVAIQRSNLANVVARSGDLLRAKDLHAQALADTIRLLGEAHPSVAARKTSLAIVLVELGDLAEAQRLLEQAVEASDRLGASHPTVGTIWFSLGRVYEKLGDRPRAIAALGRALKIEEQTLGPDGATTAFTRARLGDALDRAGNRDEAIILVQRALLAVQVAPPGSQHRVNVETIARKLGIAIANGDS